MTRDGDKLLGRTMPIGAALRGSTGPLVRQFRKFAAMNACLKALPTELEGMAAPYDVKLARQRDDGSGSESADVHTLYIYVANMTVAGVIEARKRGLIKDINAELPYAVVEDLQCEQAAQKKIASQLNILRIEPD